MRKYYCVYKNGKEIKGGRWATLDMAKFCMKTEIELENEEWSKIGNAKMSIAEDGMTGTVTHSTKFLGLFRKIELYRIVPVTEVNWRRSA